MSIKRSGGRAFLRRRARRRGASAGLLQPLDRRWSLASSSSRPSATRRRTSSASCAPSPRRSCRRRAGSSLDDGSTDGTLEILRALEPEVPFLTVVESARPSCRSRPTGSRAPPRRAPSTAASRRRRLARVHARDEARRRHRAAAGLVRELIERFAADPALGIAGGVLDRADGRRLACAASRSRAATSTGRSSCYTRECFAAIGGVQERSAGTRSTRPTRACAASTRAAPPDLVVDPPPPARPAPTARCAAAPATASAPTSRTSRPPGSRCARSRSRRTGRVGLSGLAFFYGYVRAAVAARRARARPGVPALRPPRAAPAHARRGRAARFLRAAPARCERVTEGMGVGGGSWWPRSGRRCGTASPRAWSSTAGPAFAVAPSGWARTASPRAWG